MRNFRDMSYLGLKKGLLLRSGALHRVYQRNIDALKKEHNLKVVVDLRSTAETIKRPDRILPGIKQLHIPLIPETNDLAEQDPIINVNGLDLPDLKSCYRLLVASNRKEAWTNIFNLLLEDNQDGILFHCSAGKDRTGLVIAIILTALGYDKQTIYDDYLLTNQSNLYHRIIARKIPDKAQRKIFRDYFNAHKEYLDESFNKIDKVYGSIDIFLKDCCSLNTQKIEFLKKKYLANY